MAPEQQELVRRHEAGESVSGMKHAFADKGHKLTAEFSKVQPLA